MNPIILIFIENRRIVVKEISKKISENWGDSET